jgi:pyridoxine 5-phosphate synthase
MAQARAVGADRVELYTEPYAAAWGTSARPPNWSATAAAQAALDAGLGECRPRPEPRQPHRLCAQVPGVQVSIGHALIADALELGYAATVRAYQACIDAACS